VRTSDAAATACHACGQPSLTVVPGYAALHRVASDCRPWPAGARLCVCGACGWVQKALDAAWHREVEAIYSGYDIYHQSEGVEQAVFDQDTGAAAARSERLLRAVWAHLGLPAQGRLMDVGCGNGSLLASCHRLAPEWKLVGSELSDQHRERVAALPGVEAFCSGPVAEIPGQFDVITMNHVLEHIPDPADYLRGLREKLSPGAVLVVQVPNLLRNPFDLLVADHASHMISGTLARLMATAGFEILVVSEDWLPKEITVIARAAEAVPLPQAPDPATVLAFVAKSVEWLTGVRDQAREASAAGNFGLFGTSIAATWLLGELQTAVSFFVDEDTGRIGKQHQGRPILSPAQIPAGSQVYLALTPEVAQAITRHEEMARAGAVFHLPPPLPRWTGADGLL
jgi:2-polyprenyl-3-methyl-5-hydroxy-6-metoxy-1,4-benzoquinol methylase